MTDPRPDDLEARLPLDARPGPAARISKDRAHAIVQAALDQALQAPAAMPVRATGIAALLKHPVVRAFAMAAAALLMLVGGAAAAKLVVQAFFKDEPTKAAPMQAHEPAHAAHHAQRAASLPEAQNDAEELALEAPDEPVEEPARDSAEVRKPRESRGAVETDRAPDDLLQRANRERTAGHFREAAETYAQVYERHPSTLSAYVAEVAAGSLELEHLDRPERAARLFRRALRAQPYGALDLEARQGLALALHDLGNTQEEVGALNALIAAHSDRPAAQRARARLVELQSAERTAPRARKLAP